MQMKSIRKVIPSIIDFLCNSIGWRHCAQRKLSSASWTAEGLFSGLPRPGRGWKSVKVLAGVHVCVSSLTMCVRCTVAVNRRRKWGRPREKKCMTSSLPYGLCCLKKRSYVTETNTDWTNVGLCVYLPQSKNFLDSHPFQRKHCIRPIYIFNTHTCTNTKLECNGQNVITTLRYRLTMIYPFY